MALKQTNQIPAHLRQYTIEQRYDRYTDVDQGVWRRVMQRNYAFLKDTAHPAYIDGLRKTGILVDRIPRVEEMNECLAPFGWSAVTIDGFIPGVAFFDFQARGILPIAADIRKPEHIEYTPAPDIIHEAAGHAPILSDELYARYVKTFGKIGAKALATREEHELFEATRLYSRLLEEKEATKEEVNVALRVLEEKQTAVKGVSEAEQISRLYWWTVEYGLIGSTTQPLIYGAGLLSSIGESQHCLTDAVRKIPFSLKEAISTGYNITTEQPQLFVCEDFEQLIEAVETFGEQMAFTTGGTIGLEKALRSHHTATVQYSSGLQVSGTISSLIYNDKKEAIYLITDGPTALANEGYELEGHNKTIHHSGYSAPIGRFREFSSPLEMCTPGDLEAAGVREGRRCTLESEGGITVCGILEHAHYQDGKLQLLTFRDCMVTHHDRILFRPEFGVYDMAVGERITSVFAGAADSEAFHA